MEEIISVLPKRLAQILIQTVDDWKGLQEIRIRQGKHMVIRYHGNLLSLTKNDVVVTATECKEILSQISQYSFYAFEEEICQGYLTIPGGHRIGVTGRTVMVEGKVKTIRHITCFNIRISHEIKGCAKEIYPFICQEGNLHSTLILSPPGGGKTTMLPDVIRQLSQHNNVSIVDERSEIACCYQGIPQRDVGPCCDVLDGCPKAIGMEMVLRSMGPDVIAVDEIGTERDYQAMKKALVSGCTILATMHGEEMEGVKHYGLFQRYILLQGNREPGKIRGIYDQRGRKLWG